MPALFLFASRSPRCCHGPTVTCYLCFHSAADAYARIASDPVPAQTPATPVEAVQWYTSPAGRDILDLFD